MKKNIFYIIDFDSTFVAVEALDELANIALSHRNDRDTLTKKISEITRFGMEGKIGFGESLKKRLSLFQPSQSNVQELVTFLRKNITPSVLRNKSFFHE